MRNQRVKNDGLKVPSSSDEFRILAISSARFIGHPVSFGPVWKWSINSGEGRLSSKP